MGANFSRGGRRVVKQNMQMQLQEVRRRSKKGGAVCKMFDVKRETDDVRRLIWVGLTCLVVDTIAATAIIAIDDVAIVIGGI